MHALRRLFRLLGSDRKEIFYLYVYALFNGLIYLSLPLGIQAIISLITTNQITTSWIVLVVIIALGVLLSGVAQMMQMAVTEGIQQRIFVRSAVEFAYRLPRFKLTALSGKYPPELVNRFFDTLSVQKGLSKILIDFSTSSLQVFFGLLVLSFYHQAFILFGLILIILIYILFRLLGPRGLKTSLDESTHKYKLAHWLEEVGRAMGTFKLAGKTNLPIEKTDGLLVGYLGARRKHFRILLIKYGGLVLFKVLVVTALLIIGGFLVINREMNIGQFVASEIIIIMVMNAVEKVMLSIDTVYDVLTSLEKIGQVTDIELEEDEGMPFNMNCELGERAIEVEVQNLKCFKKPCPNPPFLNLKIPAGQKVFLTGRSGSGRSSLLNVIAAKEKPMEGTIHYNGFPIETIELESLRSFIGDSLNDEDIFSGTLFENIGLGRPWATRDKVLEAIETFGLTEWYKTLPSGLQTELLPQGEQLPDHVIKKIILARGIADAPGLLVLEDFLHNMPEKDKLEMISTILDLNCTVVIAGNDALFASMCDRIIAMEEGHIIADGTFKDVAKQSSVRETLYPLTDAKS